MYHFYVFLLWNIEIINIYHIITCLLAMTSLMMCKLASNVSNNGDQSSLANQRQ